MHIHVSPLMFLPSHVIPEKITTAGEFSQHIHNSCRLFSTHSCDPAIHIYIRINTPSS